ncbi:MAG: low-specificity L-threonine aldolase [Chloroflexota bacterium]
MDLRSDTVTHPSPAMREAMANAELGDDVFGEDPTVNKLEALAAETTGKEAAVFVASGTQGNLLGVLSHCQRGDEYLVGKAGHIFRSEAGGTSVLGSAFPFTIDNEPDGTLDLEAVEAAIKPDDSHFANTRLLCLENTHTGKVLPLEYLAKASDLAQKYQIGRHLDGARVFNAAVKLGVDVREITQHFDTVSFCLSKGLSSPVGSVLVGPAEHINRARRLRKMVGGGMRQAGVLAAAGILSITQMVERLSDDHDNAHRLAQGLANTPGFSLNLDDVHTNMVYFTLAEPLVGKFQPFMQERGVKIGGGPYPIRAVTHYGIESNDIDVVLSAAAECSKAFMKV